MDKRRDPFRERPDPVRSGAQLHAWRTNEWLTDDDLTGPLVVLIHGFTSSSTSIAKIATHVHHSFPVAVFDYPSHKGIDRGAHDLSERLKRYSNTLSRTGLALVGHSMGGLVARYFARHADPALRVGLKGIATLCSPHGAARPARTRAARRRLFAMMLDFVERGAPVNPYTRSVNCRAARQLLGEDPDGLTAALLDADRTAPLQIPIL